MNFKIFAVGDDRPEYIVDIADHFTRIDDDYYGEKGPDVREIPLETVGMFEQEDGSYKEMTFRKFLGEDFVYTGPQLICWNE